MLGALEAMLGQMTIYLVDGTFEIFRSFYGAPKARGDNGHEVGATRGLLRTLAALVSRPEVTHVAAAFDTVIESSKVGARKPEARFFELVCTHLRIAAEQAVYLDDLGANLKPARAMGMRTIKVDDPATALAELETALAIVLR